MKNKQNSNEFCPEPICKEMGDREETKHLYERLCRDILSISDEKLAGQEVRPFLQLAEINSFFEFITKHIYYLWQKQNTDNKIDMTPTSHNEMADYPKTSSANEVVLEVTEKKKEVITEDTAKKKENEVAVLEATPVEEDVNSQDKSNNNIIAPNNEVEAGDDHKDAPTTNNSVNMQNKQQKIGNVGQDPNQLPQVSMPEQTKVIFKLANAMINKEYSAPLEYDSSPEVTVLKVKHLDKIGLTYSSSTGLVEGTPTQPGEYKVKVMYKLFSEGGSFESTMDFVINHDPKALWKNQPSDKSVQFWKKDEDSAEQDGKNGWSLVAASKRGRSHAHEGTCRDDDFFIIGNNAKGWHIMAVADGAGSSKYSREAARLVVEKASSLLSNSLVEADHEIVESLAKWEKDQSEENRTALRNILYNYAFREAIYDSIATLHDAAKTNNCQYHDFYTTLLLAAHKEIEGKHFVVGYWIGDGGLVMYHENEYVSLLGDGDSGEYAGQTRFLDRDAAELTDIRNRIHFNYCEKMTALFLMTDGVTDPLFETDYNLTNCKYWDNFWQEEIRDKISSNPEKTRHNLLKWLDFWSVGNHDDRSLAFLYKRKTS